MHAADIQDRDGGVFVMATMFGMYPFLMKLYADGGYQGPLFRRAVAKNNGASECGDRQAFRSRKRICPPPEAGRCRRLAKDWENMQSNMIFTDRL